MTIGNAAAEAAEAQLVLECQRAILAKSEARRAARGAVPDKPPHGWTRPDYNTPAFWQAVGDGWISEAEAEQIEKVRQDRKDRARASVGTVGPFPRRWSDPEPRESRQYANHMTTTAARDTRLTPQAKALLQIIRARCGNGLETATTKETLAKTIGRHARSIQRYIRELVAFGYIETQTRKNSIGAHTGMIVRLCEKVLPFWKDFRALGVWLQEQAGDPKKRQLLDFKGETDLSPNNDPEINPYRFREKAASFLPQWGRKWLAEPS